MPPRCRLSFRASSHTSTALSSTTKGSRGSCAGTACQRDGQASTLSSTSSVPPIGFGALRSPVTPSPMIPALSCRARAILEPRTAWSQRGSSNDAVRRRLPSRIGRPRNYRSLSSPRIIPLLLLLRSNSSNRCSSKHLHRYSRCQSCCQKQTWVRSRSSCAGCWRFQTRRSCPRCYQGHRCRLRGRRTRSRWVRGQGVYSHKPYRRRLRSRWVHHHWVRRCRVHSRRACRRRTQSGRMRSRRACSRRARSCQVHNRRVRKARRHQAHSRGGRSCKVRQPWAHTRWVCNHRLRRTCHRAWGRRVCCRRACRHKVGNRRVIGCWGRSRNSRSRQSPNGMVLGSRVHSNCAVRCRIHRCSHPRRSRRHCWHSRWMDGL
mmetsp:Transcript_91373/g.258103  ORF Transcript_91373/g.258103 Transcript_91373/m.258103 type:complete len:375 (+) Transcript_91373:290-1414(+)